MYEDKDGILWIGTVNDGLKAYNPKTEEIKTFSKSNSVLPDNEISCIIDDNKSNIYVGSIKGGLTRIDKKSGRIEQIRSTNQNEGYLPVKCLLFDSKQRLLIGTDGAGLRRYNYTSNLIENYTPTTTWINFAKYKVHSIIEDNVGNIWAGIFQKGLYLFPEMPEMFTRYGYSASGQNSIGSSCITAITGAPGELWIGTDGDGIYHLDRSVEKSDHLLLKGNEGKIEGKNILTLHNTSGDFLWAGTFLNGLLRYNKKTGAVKSYRNDPENPTSLSNDKVSSIQQDATGNLWIGTLGGGICRFDLNSERFYRGFSQSDSLNALIPLWVNDVHFDKQQNIWIGTYDGLALVDLKKQNVAFFTEANGKLSNNVVRCIQSDSKGNLWVGTYRGLIRINPTNFETKTYLKADGLVNEVICGIIEDEYSQIWISTHNGLSRLNPQENTFTNYYASDGLQANEFSRNAIYKTDKKELLFGGINGITGVTGDYRNYSRQIRDVMLTDFYRFDTPVKIGDKSGKHPVLNKSIVMADTVRLVEKDNVFSIGFTSVELANQSRITYEYMMEGFDANWNVTNSLNRRATYTNLGYGTYTFMVRGVDKEKHSNTRKLTIIIYPPWYKSLWAKIVWFILSILFLFSLMMLYQQNILRRNAEKINEMKMQFFTNISHEIKTPLTLILDPLEKLIAKNPDEETSRLYRIMRQNANRIYRLISQLLDVRKIDNGQILVKFQKTNIYDFVREIAHSYDFMALNKKIDFNIHSDIPNETLWIDPFNFEKVIFNLLSNAFKFTPAGGKVEVKITKLSASSQNPEVVRIEVIDTGIGIPKNDLERIFNRFFQSNEGTNRQIQGTGIGLHLSRLLVRLHKGTIMAENRTDGPGSRFIIELPTGNSHLRKEDLIIDENIIPAPSMAFSQANVYTELPRPNTPKSKPATNYKLMIVDDEEEIRNYLLEELSSTYKVIGFENGKQAFQAMLDEKPDLIISDIMMPEMDGITFCKKIKSNIRTSHTPIILLTALSKDEDRAEGIETGADMYLVKPFNSDFLKKSIANLLENRRKIFEKLQSTDEKFDIEPIELKSHDEILMQKVMSIIKENISNSELNVEMLADGVGISRVHMHRKLKELTNQSARDFIRNIRMKQAAYLLTSKKLNISEVAYAVGYNNLSHFSNSFKLFYGVSPTEYTQSQNIESES
jgi:signal transduction histidine kinase/ligand-binding sensor domain-containing protein/DNA-binding response OmpR family regulator